MKSSAATKIKQYILESNKDMSETCYYYYYYYRYYFNNIITNKAVPLHATEALWGRGGIAPTHSRPRH
jgi:hypothetical protein